MKLIKSLLAIFLTTSLLYSYDIKASDNTEVLTSTEFSRQADLVEKQIMYLNGELKEVDNIRVLYDVEQNPSFLYAEFKDCGYAIFTREYGGLMLYDLKTQILPFKEIDESKKIVFSGPFDYYTLEEDYFVNIDTGAHIPVSTISTEQIELNSLFIDKEANIKKLSNSKEPKAASYSYVGLPEALFTRFKNWINYDGTCGPHAAAAMLSYYDDNIDNSYVPDSLRARYSSNGTALINSLIAKIDPDKSGTFASEIMNGINNWLTQYSHLNNSHRAYASQMGDTWSFATKKIGKNTAGRPVMIGTLSILGSSYGNHWVLAYQHRLDSNDNGFYKCVDNHGSATAEVPAYTTRGYVYIGE